MFGASNPHHSVEIRDTAERTEDAHKWQVPREDPRPEPDEVTRLIVTMTSQNDQHLLGAAGIIRNWQRVVPCLAWRAVGHAD